jgi:hypothetical protein
MKRYLAAAVVAVLVFAAAAFAATFNLSDSVLAVGEAEVSDCGDAVVKSWGLETSDGTVRFVRLILDDDCYGDDADSDYVLFAAVYREDGTLIQRSGEHRLGSDPNEGDHEKVDFRSPFPMAEHIETLRVFIHTKLP